MTPLLLRIAIAGFLALSSLLVILFRVSPLTSPGLAIPFFFVTVFLAVAAGVTLVLYALWRWLSLESMDAGRCLSVALREGIFLGLATCLIFLFLVLEILTWWVAVMIYLVFILVEMALLS